MVVSFGSMKTFLLTESQDSNSACSPAEHLLERQIEGKTSHGIQYCPDMRTCGPLIQTMSTPFSVSQENTWLLRSDQTTRPAIHGAPVEKGDDQARVSRPQPESFAIHSRTVFSGKAAIVGYLRH